MVREAVGSFLTVCTLNITPKYFMSFLAFIEDIWLYQYHRKEKAKEKMFTNYPTTVNFFLEEASLIGEIKMSPAFIKFNEFLEKDMVSISKNQEMIDYLGFNQEKDVTKVYFLHSSEEVYKSNLLMNLLFYSALKLIHLLFFILRRKFRTN